MVSPMIRSIVRLFRPSQPSSLSGVREAGPTVVDEHQMSLYERKAWRLEMLRKSIKRTFESVEILGGMYRFRIMSLDERGHYYAIMVETTKHFASSNHATTPRLTTIEDLLKSHAFDNYGIMVEGVYWKVTETIDMFQRATDTAELPNTPPPPRRPTVAEVMLDFSETQPVTYDATPTEPATNIDQYDSPTAEEHAAFRAAIAQHRQPPPMHVGSKQYFTDLAPLGLN